ncbi:MAG: dockerin type I domain-containing protein, partial [Phycisphaerales bacterium]
EIGIWDDALGDFNFSLDYGQWTTCTVVETPTGGAARRLVIHGDSFPSLITGRYAIKPRLTGSARLLCDGLLPGAPDTPTANFQYEFWLEQDCNTNGVADSDEDPSFCCLAWPCDPDYNADGNVDQDDVAYLTNVIAGGANPTQRDPDFNRDGNVDQDDLAALTNAVAGGGCP